MSRLQSCSDSMNGDGAWMEDESTSSSGGGDGSGGQAGGPGMRRYLKSIMRGTIFSSLFTLLTTCIGAGTLSLPYAFKEGGLLFSSVVFVTILLISVVVGLMLFSSKRYCAELFGDDVEVWGYEDLAQIAFGVAGKLFVLLTLVALLLLSLVAYMIYTRDQLQAIVQFAYTKAGYAPECSIMVNCALLMSISFIPLFPINLLRDLTPMQFTSSISIFCIIFVAVTMLIKAILNAFADDPIATKNERHVYLMPDGVNAALTCISYCSLSFICHFNILQVQKELHRPTRGRMFFIIIGSLVGAYLIYNVVIFSGYFTFYNDIREDIILNYNRSDVLMTVARIALFFTLLFSYPVLLHPTRAALNRFLATVCQCSCCGSNESSDTCGSTTSGGTVQEAVHDEKQSLLERRPEESGEDSKAPPAKKEKKIPTVVWISETWIIFAATFLPACYVPNVGYVWNFVGSIGGTLILYIFPTAFYLKLRLMRYQKKREQSGTTILAQHTFLAVFKEAVAMLIFLVGLVLLVVENYQSINAIASGAHDSTSYCYQAKCIDNVNDTIL